jgi:hypothetical protein
MIADEGTGRVHREDLYTPWYTVAVLRWKTLLTATGFTALLLGLGTADAILTKDRIVLPSPLAADLTSTGTGMSLIPDAVTKNNGATVEAILREQSITTVVTSERSLLARIVSDPSTVHTAVLLKNGDRIALLSWTESPQVKLYFQALKDSLHSSFSPALKNLRDDTVSGNGRPTMNVLTFRDPAIAEERLFFVRVRERLFEVHATDGKEKDTEILLEALAL